MILELLGLAGVGVYLYNKYGNKDEFKRKYQSNSRDIIRAKRRYKEIDRVLFGKFISPPSRNRISISHQKRGTVPS